MPSQCHLRVMSVLLRSLPVHLDKKRKRIVMFTTFFEQRRKLPSQIPRQQRTLLGVIFQSCKQGGYLRHQQNNLAIAFRKSAVLVTQQSAAAKRNDAFLFVRKVFHQCRGLKISKGCLALRLHDPRNGHTRIGFDNAIQIHKWQFEIVCKYFSNCGFSRSRRTVDENMSHQIPFMSWSTSYPA